MNFISSLPCQLMRLGITLGFFCVALAASAQRNASVFKDPEFQKRFMGSYGFLPDVEPSIDTEDEAEREYFLEIKDLLASDQMGTLKAKLLQDMDPDLSHPALQFMLANLYFQEEKNSEAEKWYRSAIRKFPSYLRAHKNLGLVYFQREDNAKAVESLSEAVKLGDRSSQTVGLLGLCHLNQENWLASESALRQAIVLDPKNSQWESALVKVFFNSEQFEAALSMIDSALGEKPGDTNLWLMKGRALMELNRPDEASVAFETLRHLGKATPQILEILGALYMDQEKANAALSAYLAAAKASTKLKGSSVLRTANLLFGYQYLDQSKRYVSQLRPRFNELTDQEQLEMLTLEAKLARADGDQEKAMGALQKVIEQDNRNGEARIELAQLFAMQAKEAEDELKRAEYESQAKIYFEQALQIEDSEAMAALRYGQMLVGQNEYLKAVPLLTKSYQLRPKDEVDQYIKRVERAARRQEAKEAELKKAAAPAPPKK